MINKDAIFQLVVRKEFEELSAGVLTFCGVSEEIVIAKPRYMVFRCVSEESKLFFDRILNLAFFFLFLWVTSVTVQC